MFPVQLHYLRLPKDLSEDHVILMDCTVSTGAAAMLAIRVLLVSASNPTAYISLFQPPINHIIYVSPVYWIPIGHSFMVG